MKEIVLVMGFPGCGKTTVVEADEFKGYTRLNRDLAGGSLEQLAKTLDQKLTAGDTNFVLDNTYPSVKSRKPIIDVAKKFSVPVRCVYLKATIEDAQYNVAQRMMERYGKLLMPDEISDYAKKDPNMFPTAVLFKYKKELEEPSPSEGFAKIETRKFVRRPQGSEYNNFAVIFDYDGTLRETLSGDVYPKTPDDIRLMPGRKEKLQQLAKSGVLLLGVSNQGDIARGKLTLEQAKACFDRTNELLGVKIEYSFCPHNPAPIQCYCRKPMPGLGVQLIERHKLDRSKTIYVGDMTTDKTFAARSLIKYIDQADYFK